MVNYKKNYYLHELRLVSLQASLDVEGKKSIFKNRWRFSKKAKGLIVFAIIAVMLISVFAFLPKQGASNIVPQNTDNPSPTPSPAQTARKIPQSISSSPPLGFSSMYPNWADIVSSKTPGIIESAQTINSSVWMAVGNNSWRFFQPGVGVDPNTGLPYAGGAGFTGFTDWDLGVYIQAVIDAQKIGLVNSSGAWGADYRFDKVLTFLEIRQLNNANYPYQFYQAIDGKYNPSSSNATLDLVDTGRLFVALNNLRNFDSNLTERIVHFVYNNNVVNNNKIVSITNGQGNRSDYAALVPVVKNDATSNSIYAYFFYSGFASFWPQQLGSVPSSILDNLINSQSLTTYNVSLPNAPISCDPLLCSVFELNNNDSRLLDLARQVYLAHQDFYNATGNYAAFGEGNSPSNGYIWEWVATGNGDTWKITSGSNSYVNMDPVVFNKVAFGFLSLYNTTFARNMLIFLEQHLPDPTNGYSDGVDIRGNIVWSVGSNTNGLILDAALYCIQNDSV